MDSLPAIRGMPYKRNMRNSYIGLCPILLPLAAPIYVCFIYLQVLFPLYMFYFFFKFFSVFVIVKTNFIFVLHLKSQGRSEIPNEKVTNTWCDGYLVARGHLFLWWGIDGKLSAFGYKCFDIQSRWQVAETLMLDGVQTQFDGC